MVGSRRFAALFGLKDESTGLTPLYVGRKDNLAESGPFVGDFQRRSEKDVTRFSSRSKFLLLTSDEWAGGKNPTSIFK